MLRSELIWMIAKEGPPSLTHDRMEAAVDVVLEEIISALERGDRVELRRFGSFTARKRLSHAGRNPRTGAPVQVEEKHAPFFRAGKLLRDRLNGKA